MSFYTDFQHKIYFLLIKSLSLLPTMYILVHFKLSYKNTSTSINRVNIHIFTAALDPWKCDFFYLICRYKCKKIALFQHFITVLDESYECLLPRSTTSSVSSVTPATSPWTLTPWPRRTTTSSVKVSIRTYSYEVFLSWIIVQPYHILKTSLSIKLWVCFLPKFPYNYLTNSLL